MAKNTRKKKNNSPKNKVKKTLSLVRKEKMRLTKIEYMKNPINRIAANLRSRISRAIKRNQKTGSAISDLGCTLPELKAYLEFRFQSGMTWLNYGKWHIDHIKPLTLFDLTNKDQLLMACHYTNLQPLWAKDNIKKSNKYET